MSSLEYYTPAFIDRLTRLFGGPLVRLFELQIPGEAPHRYAANNEAVVFHGNTFDPIGINMPSLDEGGIDSPKTFQIAVSNVTRLPVTLAELYWIPSADTPLWVITLWHVHTDSPNDTPLVAGAQFDVLSIHITDEAAIFELRPLYLAQTQQVPARFFTSTGGFEILARR